MCPPCLVTRIARRLLDLSPPLMSADGQGELEPEVPRKNVVGLFCGAAFHDVVFARVSGCDVVRLYDWELRMRKLACLFFPKRGVVKEMDIRAENIGALEADIGLAVPAADAWVHVNAGLPCQDGSKVNFRRKPAQLREHVATFFILIQRLQSKYRKVTWFAENVVCPEFVDAMKALFPEANCAVVNHASFSAERRKRAYFATQEFDLTALSRLTGSCTVAEFFDIDERCGPYAMRSGSSGCKSNCEWHSIEEHAPTLTSNGLVMRNERTKREWRVPNDSMAELRSLAALPKSQVKDVTARRCAVARAVDGKVSQEIARQLSAMR